MFYLQDEDGLTAVNLNILPRLWIPDVEILDLMSFETHKVLSKLEGNKKIHNTVVLLSKT
jgi:hypothetical protein